MKKVSMILAAALALAPSAYAMNESEFMACAQDANFRSGYFASMNRGLKMVERINDIQDYALRSTMTELYDAQSGGVYGPAKGCDELIARIKVIDEEMDAALDRIQNR